MVQRLIKRVGLDLDGTVADYMSSAVPLLKKHYGLEPNYNINAHTVEEIFGITRESRPPGMRRLLYEDLRLFSTLSPIKGMVKLTQCLGDMGCLVYFITSRASIPVIVQDTTSWLCKHNFYWTDVFHTADKTTLCKTIDIDVMVEDEIAQILSLVYGGINVVVYNQPWNQDIPITSPASNRRIKRAFNAQEALSTIKEFL